MGSHTDCIIVVDAWAKWPEGDTLQWPTLEEEAHAYGAYLNTQLNHIRTHYADIFHYSHVKNVELMQCINRESDTEINHILTEGALAGYSRIFVCGFHYGICIESVCKIIDHIFLHPPLFQIATPIQFGIVENLSIRHPKHSHHEIKSTFDHYAFSQKLGFELNEKRR